MSKKSILIENLVFAYNKQQPVLREISLSINASDRVALIGKIVIDGNISSQLEDAQTMEKLDLPVDW
jgi:ABC-type transport system involved in Fe-S cluster assembly fused permease/ATPase subunit